MDECPFEIQKKDASLVLRCRFLASSSRRGLEAGEAGLGIEGALRLLGEAFRSSTARVHHIWGVLALRIVSGCIDGLNGPLAVGSAAVVPDSFVTREAHAGRAD